MLEKSIISPPHGRAVIRHPAFSQHPPRVYLSFLNYNRYSKVKNQSGYAITFTYWFLVFILKIPGVYNKDGATRHHNFTLRPIGAYAPVGHFRHFSSL